MFHVRVKTVQKLDQKRIIVELTKRGSHSFGGALKDVMIRFGAPKQSRSAVSQAWLVLAGCKPRTSSVPVHTTYLIPSRSKRPGLTTSISTCALTFVFLCTDLQWHRDILRRRTAPAFPPTLLRHDTRVRARVQNGQRCDYRFSFGGYSSIRRWTLR
jgi:hypothetical protein